MSAAHTALPFLLFAAGPGAKLLGKLGLGKKNAAQEKAAEQKAEAAAPVLAGSAVVYRMPVSFDPSILDIMGVSPAACLPACLPAVPHLQGLSPTDLGACRLPLLCSCTVLPTAAAGPGCPRRLLLPVCTAPHRWPAPI